MRIGILCHPTYGGSCVVASELALSLSERGHSVHLFSHDVPPRLARAPGHTVELHVAQGSPYPLFHSTPHDLAIMSRVLDLHRSDPLDVLHAHYALPHAISALLVRSAAAEAGLPPLAVVTTLNGTDITLVGNDPSYAPLTQYAITASNAVTAASGGFASGGSQPPRAAMTNVKSQASAAPCALVGVAPAGDGAEIDESCAASRA